jgi:hypothetical protein
MSVPLRWVVLALVGSAICTVGDHLHATHGVLVYPRPDFWEQAWWVPLLFAAASIVTVAGAGPLRQLLGGRHREAPAPTARQLAGDGIAFVAAYVYTSFAPADRPNVTLAVLVAFWAARVVRGAPAWLIVYSLILGVAGSAFEGTWSALGFFHYVHPDVAGVPRWLPGIYLHVGVAAGSLEILMRGALPRR